jgi:anaerobic dimethyl sulfoxide reductase subunit B (iron-sulfur subunit)
MQKGFIFNYDKCVNCSSCNAACVLENEWTIQPRNIYIYNVEIFPLLPHTNFSLACNHCEKPVCLEGCPASSIYREALTGAVIVDEKKCIGCKYCQWNCPYDAPKFDKHKQTIGKCDLCYTLLIDNGLPACVNACPTGALNFDDISGPHEENAPPWFPDKRLKPAIRLIGSKSRFPLRIIPENKSEVQFPVSVEKEKNIKGEWSLVAFSFLTLLSVSEILTSLIRGVFPYKILFLSLIILAGLSSLFHLGKISRAWRSVSNIKSSPLSREIALFILYSLFSLVSVIFRLPVLIVVSSIIGLILLIAIDMVYSFADERKSTLMHSGQTFLSALLIASFLSGFILPFIFIAVIKLTSLFINMRLSDQNLIKSCIRFIRISLLFVAGASLVSKISYPDTSIIFIFLTGELLDRVLYYYDFEPLNISTLIKNHLTAAYEKKRG